MAEQRESVPARMDKSDEPPPPVASPSSPTDMEPEAAMEHLVNGQRCSYRVVGDRQGGQVAVVSIHPIGVGLSSSFWNRFDTAWTARDRPEPLVHPDLLGCGLSAMPRRAILPGDWGEQVAALVTDQLKRPVLLLVQGASAPIAFEVHRRIPDMIRGMVLMGPPSWRLISEAGNPAQGERLWQWFFATPAGALFYRYARTERFLRSFSIRQLFDEADAVDAEWLSMLREGARSMDSRYAVFSFLAGWWQQDYTDVLATMSYPVLALFGEHASGISNRGRRQSPERKLSDYTTHLPSAQGRLLPGRNVLPWESAADVAEAICSWWP